LATAARITGFLPDAEYWSLLRHARCIAVLTAESGCVPCGGYEAIAVGRRPVVLDDPAVRAIFREEAVYVRPQVDALVHVITEESERGELPREDLAPAYEMRWQHRWAVVGNLLTQKGFLGAL
jgi:hypothetical protein